MTKEQEAWTNRIVGQLREEARKRMPLSDADWEELVKSISVVFQKSKKNKEVKKALVKFLLECEKMNEEVKIKNNYEKVRQAPRSMTHS